MFMQVNLRIFVAKVASLIRIHKTSKNDLMLELYHKALEKKLDFFSKVCYYKLRLT